MWIDVAAHAIRVVVAILAFLVAARCRRQHRPLAILFAGVAVADLLSLSIVPLIQGQPTPYQGLSRVAFHVTQACFLFPPAAIAALFGVVFRRRSARGIIVLSLAITAGAFLSYPWLRRAALGWFYAGVYLLAFIYGIASLVQWFRRAEPPELEHKITIYILVMNVAAWLGPYWHGDPFARWSWAQMVYGVLYAFLVAVYGRFLWTWSSSSASQSRSSGYVPPPSSFNGPSKRPTRKNGASSGEYLH